MPRAGTIGHRKGGGRVKGTPNKRSLVLRQALERFGCRLEEQVAGLLQDAEVDKSLKVDLVAKLLPYVYPQLRPVDPEGYLSPEQAAGMLGAQATKFRNALSRYISDQMLISLVMDDLRAQTTNGGGASPPSV